MRQSEKSGQHERWMLAGAFLRNPRGVSALAPSGSALAAAMAAQVPPGPGLVIELGGGTGSITAALLARDEAPGTLLVVERDAALCRGLARRYPVAQALHGDARRLPALLRAAGVQGPVKAVISGLPLLSMSREAQADILGGVAGLLAPGCAMVQFTYGLVCPVSSVLLLRLGLRGRRLARVWRNLPPACVWRFERPRDAAGWRHGKKLPR